MLAETTRFKTNRISLFEGGYRLEWDLNTGKSELFHTQEDLKETTDISNAQPEIAFAFQKTNGRIARETLDGTRFWNSDAL